MDELSTDINEWLNYNNSISKINDYLKGIKEKKNKLEESILFKLEEHKLTDKKLRIGDNHIIYNISQTMPPISLKLLDNVLSECIHHDSKDKILEKIQLYRENNKSQSICLKKKNINRKKSNKNNKL